MHAVHLEQGLVSTVTVPRPRRRRGYALIRLRLAGICHTDIELRRGYYGFRGRPGHEFVGEVVAGSGAWIGKRVVGEINLACGRCAWCARGLGRHCPARRVLGIVRHPGAFAEYFTLPEENLHEVPTLVPDERAVFTEPVAAAGEIVEQVRIPKGAPVAVLGDGKLGLLIAQVLGARGAIVHLFGHHRAKLRIAAAAGIRTSLARGGRPRMRFPFVVEATGRSASLESAIGMTLPRGTLVLKSTVHGPVRLKTAPLIVDEITIVGSRCGRFAPALKLIRAGKLNLDAMITDRFPLSEASRAFARAEQRGALKVLLEP